MSKHRSEHDVCLYCFGTLNEDRVCMTCGRRADDKPALPNQLARRTILAKRYLIDKAIGEGGFGITYSAWDLTDGRHVAIKEYYPSGYVSRDTRNGAVIIGNKKNHAATNRGLKRFIDEAQNLARVSDHSGVVAVLDFFSANNTAYIVMEFLDGISLKKYVRRKGKLDEETVLTILKPVVYSLREVHAAGLIHRDISPDNILITKNGEVKLIDFGAAEQTNPDGRSVSIVLKQGYAPEEQYRLRGEQGPWTDIYALGVTIYYCLTAQLPPESIQRMYDDTIVPPSKLGAKVSPATEAALMRAMAVFAADRFKNMDELIAALYSGRKNDEIAAEVIEKDVIKAEQQRRLARERDGSDGLTATVSVNSTIIIGKAEAERAAAENQIESARRAAVIEHRHTPDKLRKRMSEGLRGNATETPTSGGTIADENVATALPKKDGLATALPADGNTIDGNGNSFVRSGDDPITENADNRRYRPVVKKYGNSYADALRKKFTDR